jgi:nucleoside-specific outer membrane channel protein Tsx
MSQYSFIDNNYFTKDDSDKNIFNVSKEFKDIQSATSLNKGILNPDISIIPVKDIEKGI